MQPQTFWQHIQEHCCISIHRLFIFHLNNPQPHKFDNEQSHRTLESVLTTTTRLPFASLSGFLKNRHISMRCDVEILKCGRDGKKLTEFIGKSKNDDVANCYGWSIHSENNKVWKTSPLICHFGTLVVVVFFIIPQPFYSIQDEVIIMFSAWSQYYINM